MDTGTAFHGPNAAYVLELYEQYLADPASVDEATRDYFANWTPTAVTAAIPAGTAIAGIDPKLIGAAASYSGFIRRYGHLGADLNPIRKNHDKIPDELQPETYGLTTADLASIPASAITGTRFGDYDSALDITRQLLAIYSDTTGYEFHHIQDKAERDWLYEAAESGRYLQPFDEGEKTAILQSLTKVEGFEQFLHQSYLGQKRFSIEGMDVLVPMLEETIYQAHQQGIQGVIIGMAHRGRLNVLTHVLGKPYSAMIAEFEHVPRPAYGLPDISDPGYSGDVKYHMGWRSNHAKSGDISVLLAPNPSHLEYVDPVAEGLARARQENRSKPGEPEQNYNASLPVILHGDAAFPGQGIVSETLNLARLRGYNTGGTLHIITNNQVGFTTDPDDSRSTLYASDLAKGFEIPVVHVNADDPVAALGIARMALDYRNTFNRDFLIDLVGYRRWGHNEGDEPTFTQPGMYESITSHPTTRALWASRLEREGVIPEGEGEQLLNAHIDNLVEIRRLVQEGADLEEEAADNNDNLPTSYETEVDAEQLMIFNEELHSFPDDFTLNSKLGRQLIRRKEALEQPGAIDWAHAESLAFASILADGVPIRMTGQDTERGTFSHRHLVLHDASSYASLTLLQQLQEADASFAVYNSPLSEAAVLGFEYGYSVSASEALVLWEAQFGDFANSAQVIIDQFITTAPAKWLQSSGLVLLLPHGYEGQGPEHSSARLERFLQLSANDNIRVANLTTSAQYFHILRRQSKMIGNNRDRRPLILMTPKSLLRHPMAGSSLVDLAAGSFQTIIDDESANTRRNKVRRLVLCSGKIYVDLATSELFQNVEDVAVVRVEELYPLDISRLEEIIAGYQNLEEIVWVQEEPRNMGAWTYMAPRLVKLVGRQFNVQYMGRREEASPAEGSLEYHREIQTRIVQDALQVKRAVQASAADD